MNDDASSEQVAQRGGVFGDFSCSWGPFWCRSSVFLRLSTFYTYDGIKGAYVYSIKELLE